VVLSALRALRASGSLSLARRNAGTALRASTSPNLVCMVATNAQLVNSQRRRRLAHAANVTRAKRVPLEPLHKRALSPETTASARNVKLVNLHPRSTPRALTAQQVVTNPKRVHTLATTALLASSSLVLVP